MKESRLEAENEELACAYRDIRAELFMLRSLFAHLYEALEIQEQEEDDLRADNKLLRALVRELVGALSECRGVIGLRLSHPEAESLFASTGHLLSRIPENLR